MNKSVPRIEPCGTPVDMCAVVEIVSLKSTNCLRLSTFWCDSNLRTVNINNQKADDIFMILSICQPQWSIRSGCGSKLRGTELESRSDVSYRDCGYTVLKTTQINEVCSAVYGTVHYKEALKSFVKSRVSFCRDIAMIV